MFLPGPTRDEIDAIKRGSCRFGLMVVELVIFFLYDFGGKIDGDATYTIHAVPVTEQVPPSTINPGQQALLHVILIDATTGIIKALRVVSLSANMSAALHGAINNQINDPFEFNIKRHDEVIARIHHDFTMKRMFKEALTTTEITKVKEN